MKNKHTTYHHHHHIRISSDVNLQVKCPDCRTENVRHFLLSNKKVPDVWQQTAQKSCEATNK
jgi:hypothetical protein